MWGLLPHVPPRICPHGIVLVGPRHSFHHYLDNFQDIQKHHIPTICATERATHFHDNPKSFRVCKDLVI